MVNWPRMGPFPGERGGPDSYPSGYGDGLRASTGEPDIALIDTNGRLGFLAAGRNRGTITEGGWSRSTVLPPRLS